MEGGFHAWEGLAATGVPESGMPYFTAATKAEERALLAWQLEEGSRKFYAELASTIGDQEAVTLYRELATAEERHTVTLLDFYRTLTGAPTGPGFPGTRAGEQSNGRMEGGMAIAEALSWAQGRSLTEVLELTIGLEANSYDLYIKMERAFQEKNSRDLFNVLAAEEKNHLGRMAALLDKKL